MLNIQPRKGCTVDDLKKVIPIAAEACKAFGKARDLRRSSWFAYGGEIEVDLAVLERVKKSKVFGQNTRKFVAFLAVENPTIPSEMQKQMLSSTIQYFRNLPQSVEELVDAFYQWESVIKDRGPTREPYIRWKESEQHMVFLRSRLYDLVERQKDMKLTRQQASSTAYIEHKVRSMLFGHQATVYSSWSSIPDGALREIVTRLLKPALQTPGDLSGFSLLALLRAAVECKLQDHSLTTDLLVVASRWAERREENEYAYLFAYMLHFPHSKSIPNAKSKFSADKVDLCSKTMQRKYGDQCKSSRPRYLLGRGEGIAAFVPADAIPGIEQARDIHVSTDFWRNPVISRQLKRVSGYQESLGRIRYRQEFTVRVDPSFHTRGGKQKVFFCLGFTFHGPVAYDPVSEREMSDLKKLEDFPRLGEGMKTASASDYDESAAGACADRTSSQPPSIAVMPTHESFLDACAAGTAQFGAACFPEADTDPTVAAATVIESPDASPSLCPQHGGAVASTPTQPIRMSYAAAAEKGMPRSVKEPTHQAVTSTSKKKQRRRKQRKNHWLLCKSDSMNVRT